MKKWFIIIGIVCLILIWQLLLLYRGFKSAEVEAAEQALAVAETESHLASVRSVDYYPGDEGYHVIIGEDSGGEAIIVWVQGDDVWEEQLSDGVTRKHILAKLPEAEIRRIMPGMITTSEGEKQPIWDVYYVTDEGKVRYAYFDFFTGETIKTIPL